MPEGHDGAQIFQSVYVQRDQELSQDLHGLFEIANHGTRTVGVAPWYGCCTGHPAEAGDQGDVYDNMTVALLSPYFNSDMAALDVVWVNNWPSPVEQFKGLETWVTGGGDKLLKSLPSENSAQVDAWQWTISDPAEFGVGGMMYATYADCSNADGYSNRSVYDLYMDFASMVKEDGDTIGRKMIVPNAGRALPEGVDFIRLMYTASISEAGVNQALFTENFEERQETKDLIASFSCTNARTYTGLVMRAPE